VNGWASSHHSAAVQAGSIRLEGLPLSGSPDAGNAITVETPALFLWPVEQPARAFGLTSWSLLVPQTLAEIAVTASGYGVPPVGAPAWTTASSARRKTERSGSTARSA
jgi:hypothetical protein